MDVQKLEALLSVQQVADMFEVPARVVRKSAKNGTLPGTVKVLGKFGFDPEVVTGWEPPEAGEFGAPHAKREDGRQRYRIYLTPEEAAKLLAEGYEVSDPREAAKARRAARRAQKAAAGTEVSEAGAEKAEDEDDPFADFGA